ncbi:Zn(2)-C6 fungal-type domain-containing protein [Mycena indigotica]|uniref:Zn(2)-C6 fungal-type domain-containing protein n=1 Tax=Mycena indigotica TaxID=2126181 RepID=A0A8H6SP99_9AGAR|nr:Zn(2)-C6 fungal-type domain-containing protein [Mycena indigotica]KAF7303500.1 Zn(2)-C6 fungal-type domain-containing protein [Mycena indigotica]
MGYAQIGYPRVRLGHPSFAEREAGASQRETPAGQYPNCGPRAEGIEIRSIRIRQAVPVPPSLVLIPPPPPRWPHKPFPPPHPIRLPSYKELALAADIDGPLARSFQPLPRPTKGVVLPPLKVPSRPLRKEDGPVHDRFLDLARHCPAAPPPNKEWTSPSPYSAYRPTSASSVTPVTTALPTPIVSNPPPHPLPVPQQQHAPQPPQYDPLASEPLRFSHATRPGFGPPGRTKKQALSCFFCRERKIACGRPEDGSVDGRCNQCARRKIACTYPTVSHRGQHSRLKSAARSGNRSHKGAGPEVEAGSLSPSPERTTSASPLSVSSRDSYAGVPLLPLHAQSRYGHGMS